MVSDLLLVRPGLNVRKIDDEIVIVDMETGDVHQLNPTASYIWQLCDGKTSIDSIIDSFMKQYGITDSVAQGDVRTVIENLQALKLLV